MIVDSSAIVAILREEPEAELFRTLLERDSAPKMSAATYVEVGAIVDGACPEPSLARVGRRRRVGTFARIAREQRQHEALEQLQSASAPEPSLAELAVASMAPVTAEMRRLMADTAEIDKVLKDGAERAGDEDTQQGPLVGFGGEEHRPEEAAEEAEPAEERGSEQGVDEPAGFGGGGAHGLTRDILPRPGPGVLID